VTHRPSPSVVSGDEAYAGAVNWRFRYVVDQLSLMLNVRLVTDEALEALGGGSWVFAPSIAI
jgi:hypothetical protein